jgi:hypothetical protein
MLRASFRRGLIRAEVVVLAGIGAISIGLLFPAVQKKSGQLSGDRRAITISDRLPSLP